MNARLVSCLLTQFDSLKKTNQELKAAQTDVAPLPPRKSWSALTLDLSENREDLAQKIKLAWRGPSKLQPLFLVPAPAHLLELLHSVLHDTLERRKERNKYNTSDSPPSGSSEECYSPQLVAFRREMEQFGLQILALFLNDEQDIKHFKAHPESRLSVRSYPRDSERRMLGAHCDANEITILWANGPGLQVPDSDQDLSTGDIKAIGIPSLSGPQRFCEKWCDVGSDNTMFIVSIGAGFFDRQLWQQSDGEFLQPGDFAECALLHRVFIPDNEQDRYSVPYLMRIARQQQPQW